jgi:hypothetical protein
LPQGPAAADRASAPELARSFRPPSGDSRNPRLAERPPRPVSFDFLPLTPEVAGFARRLQRCEITRSMTP